MANTVHCPDCGSSLIRERNVAYAQYLVGEWELDEHGTPRPADYNGEAEQTPWQAVNGDRAYVCGSCAWSGSLQELRIEGERPLDPDEPKPARRRATQPESVNPRPGSMMEAILSALQDVPQTASDIAATIGHTTKRVGIQLCFLAKEGRCTRAGYGKYVRKVAP